MENALKFGVTFTIAQQVTGILDFAPFAEELGYDSVWCNDHLVWRRPLFDCLTVLAGYAARTTRVQIGSAVLILPLRNPALLAKAAATLDILSGGRLILGLGAGGEYPKEFEACGIAVKERGRRTDEAIEVMKRLWSGESVSYEGRFYRFAEISMAPRPLQRPHPPLFIGGRADPSLRRVARFGDAFFPYFLSPDSYAARLAQVHEYMVGLGRAPAALEAAHMLHICAGSTREQARETAAASIVESYSLGLDAQAMLDKFCAYGTPADCAARIGQFIAAGARHFVFEPLCSPATVMRQYEMIAREVLPLVRGS